jgi:ribosomal protein S18 acetylase RimI-like enzyme
MLIRPVHLPADRSALLRLDTSFTTNRVYHVQATPLSFTLMEKAVQPPLCKAFSLADELDAERLWEQGFVAQHGDEIVGFVAVRTEVWNQRAAIWHLYVAPPQRGQGIGQRLLDVVEEYARRCGSRCLWLETSNVNYPAVHFYQRVGFSLCGLDQSLYPANGEASGETALYFVRPIA